MKAIDLFCGAGGLTHGLQRAGWDVMAGVDADPTVAETYQRNNPEARFVQADLRSVTDDDLCALAGAVPRRELLLAGCAPCQPFSKQHRRRGFGERSDATLLLEFARLIRALRPGAVLMENVPGVASSTGLRSLRPFLRTLRDCGYDYDRRVLNARDFGVPQHRRRFVLLAVQDAPASLPPAADVRSEVRHFTVRDAIGHFPEIAAGETHDFIPNHHAARLSPLNMERIKAVRPDGGGRRDWPKRLELGCHRRAGIGFSDVYGRMWWDRAAPTLTSRCNSLSNGRFGHPEQHRAVSLREAAALQTFSDDYEFFGSKNGIARWIGNAVPVRFAEALGSAAWRAVT